MGSLLCSSTASWLAAGASSLVCGAGDTEGDEHTDDMDELVEEADDKFDERDADDNEESDVPPTSGGGGGGGNKLLAIKLFALFSVMWHLFGMISNLFKLSLFSFKNSIDFDSPVGHAPLDVAAPAAEFKSK